MSKAILDEGERGAHQGELERALIVSSDGHVAARMPDYAPYMPRDWREEFEGFCEVYERDGSRTLEAKSLLQRLDPDLVDEWDRNVLQTGRLEGVSDPHMRLQQLDLEGVAGEVLFPDFGLPFELHPPLLAAKLGYSRTPEQVEVANRAHNRWLADFCQGAPERFVGLAVVSFDDVDGAFEEIRWARSAGLRGIVLPQVDEAAPFFHEKYEPIWSLLEELEMPAVTHGATSAITNRMPMAMLDAVPHPACAVPLVTAQLFFFVRQILNHLIWGGVLERHPNLQVVMTEQGTGWIIGALQDLDYSWEHSFLRRDIREVVRQKPSEYFKRQCHMGSSLFSAAEAEARHEIGVDKIQIGMDFPHHEGTWGAGPGNVEYLRATLGAAGVPSDEARLMVGENARRLWQLDRAALAEIAANIGPTFEELLTPPVEDLFPRGDVHKPLAGNF